MPEVKERTLKTVDDNNIARALGISEDREAELDDFYKNSMMSDDNPKITDTLSQIHEEIEEPGERYYCVLMVGSVMGRSQAAQMGSGLAALLGGGK